MCLKRQIKPFWQELISCHFKKYTERVWHAIWFYILSKASYSDMDTHVCVCVCERSMLTPRSTIRDTQDHIITFLPWQAVSSSAVLSSSVTWRQWCGCNKTCGPAPLPRLAEAGGERVPIPNMPCSAICHWAGGMDGGTEGGRGRSHSSCCHLDGPHSLYSAS